MKRKYKLTAETLTNKDGKVLHQIVALKDFGTVKEGDVGGWIEDEMNLSQAGDCWVFDDAKVYSNARVYGNAQVFGNTHVFGNAKVFGYAQVYSKAQVFDNAKVYGNARVFGHTWVYNDAQIYDYSEAYGNANVFGDAQVSGTARIGDDANVFGDAQVCGNTKVLGNVRIRDGKITKTSDFVCVGPQGSRDDYTTYNKLTNTVVCGCFKGSLEDFIKQVKETYPNEDNEYRQQYDSVIKTFKLYKIKTL